MYDFKQKTPEEIAKAGTQMEMMQVMGMNRKDRRQFSKVNRGIKIPASTKPVVNIKQK